MPRSVAALAAVLLAVALIAPTATATESTPGPTTTAGLTPATAAATVLTLSEQPTAIVKGTVLEFDVDTQPAAPGAAVRLERRLAPDGAWHTVASGTLDVNGTAAFTAKPNTYRSFAFRVVMDGPASLASEPQTVKVVRTADEAAGPGQLTPAAAVTVTNLPATLPKGDTLEISATTDRSLTGVTARLERRLPPSSTWWTVGTTAVDLAGKASFTAKPNSYRSFDFRVAVDTAPVSLSRTQTVTVVEPPPPPPPAGGGVTATVNSLPSTVSKGQEVSLTVSTKPALPGTTANLERRVAPGGAWATVGAAALDRSGAATLTAKPNSFKTFEFRVSVATQPVTHSRTQSVRVVSGVAPGSAGFVPRAGALFNNPFGSGSVKHRISKRIEDAINATPTGETIRLAMYSFSRPKSLKAVLAAHSRGVNMQVVLNDHDVTSQIVRLKQVLGTNANKPSFVTVCDGGCRLGSRGNQHMKFVAFSKTGGVPEVLMVTSGNLTGAGGAWQWNDMLTITGRPTLYKNFAEIFDELAQDRRVAKPYRYVSDGPYTAEFFPAANTKSNDPIWRELSRVKCRGASGGTGVAGRTVVQSTAWTWRGNRGMYLAKRLRELDNQGCIVQVVVGAPSPTVLRELRRMGPYGGVEVRDSRRDYKDEGYGGEPSFTKGSHMKYVLINGVYGSDTSYKTVVTGSLNWTDGAVASGDEVVVTHTSSATHSSYVANFKTMFNNRNYTTILRNY